jgi:hypothetical protein
MPTPTDAASPDADATPTPTDATSTLAGVRSMSAGAVASVVPA